MRHGKKVNHLSRTKEHRKALLTNMASSLILHKRINTTLAKAKALRVYVEPIITKSKTNTTHSRRIAFSYLQDKHAVKELFGEVANKVADRPGGYTRILKTGNRLGDNAETAIIELVDYNEYMLEAKAEKAGKTKTRRSRRGKGGAAKAKTAADTTAKTEEVEEVKAEEANTVEEKPKADAEVKETPKAEVKEETKAEAPKTEEVKEEAPKADDDTKADETEK
ncbi:MAG: 50S ribosomal protein L17 [bacterium]